MWHNLLRQNKKINYDFLKSIFVKFSLLVFLFSFFLVSPIKAYAANYYFDSVSGLDSNSGTSSDSSWQTLAKINSTAYIAGDTVNLKRGSSWSGALTINSSGTSSNPITFQAYGTGVKPTFSKTGLWAETITINGSYIILDGILVTNTSDKAVTIADGANNNIIRNIEISNSGQGIYLFGQNNLVTQNYIHDLVIVVNTVGGNDDYGAAGVIIANNNNEISSNIFENCKASSYDFGEDGGAVEIYGNADGSYIHQNWARGNAEFLEVGSDGTGTAINVTVSYNVSIDSLNFVGIHFGGVAKEVIDNFKLENNTIIETTNRSSMTIVGLWDTTPPSATNLIFRNNIIYSNKNISDGSTFTHDHNLYYLLNGAYLGFTAESSEIVSQDPLFVDLGSYNLHLQSGSPARGVGTNVGLTTDFEGKTVPSTPDIGAFQYGPLTATSVSQSSWDKGIGQNTWVNSSKYLSASGLTTNALNQLSITTPSSWYPDQSGTHWTYRKKITIDHTKVGRHNDTLADFPLLLNVTDDDLKNNEPHDYDILFTEADGTTKFSHEIEKYDATTGSLVAWVKIPALSSSLDTVIYLYYGNTTNSTDQQNKADVWSNGYVAIYHLGETSGHHVSSTGVNNTTSESVSQQGADGGTNLDGADTFNGTNSVLTVADNNSLDLSTGATLEEWVKINNLPSVRNQDAEILRKAHTTDPWNVYYLDIRKADNILQFDYDKADGSTRGAGGTTALTAGQWYYVAGSRDPSQVIESDRAHLYVNGRYDESWVVDDAGAIVNGADNLTIGAAYNGASRLDGMLDEIRISNIVRPYTYFSTTYNNITSPSTFYALNGSETTTSANGLLTSSIYDTGQASNWGSITYSGTAPESTALTTKTRTGNNPDMSDAAAWSSCAALNSGDLLTSDTACVANNKRYIQYQVNLATTDTSKTPTLNSLDLEYSSTNAPTITTVASITSSANGGTVTWITDKLTSSAVEYGPTTSYGSLTSETDISLRVNNHLVTLSGLNTCTTYHYRVRSKDGALSEVVGGDSTFKTTGCPSTSSNNSSPQTSSPSAPSCSDTTPTSISDLFQIDTTGSTAKLYFTTLRNNVTGYAISYGLKPGEERYGTSVSYSGSKWIIDTTINYLSSNTTYYFKVKPLNGCNAGGWSKEIAAKTTGSKNITRSNYPKSIPTLKNLKANLVSKSVTNNSPVPLVTSPVSPTVNQPQPKPTNPPTKVELNSFAQPTPTPSKHCFLFFCW